VSELEPGTGGPADLMIKAVLLGVVPCTCVYFCALLFSRRLAKRATTQPGRRSWALALALGVAYSVGHVAIVGWPALPPQETMHWLLPGALLAMVVGVLDALWEQPWALRLGTRIALTALLTWLVLRPLLQPEVVDGVRWPVMTAIVIAGVFFWSGLEALADRVVGRPLLATLLVVTTAASGALAAGSLMHGQLAGVLSGALFGAFAVALFISGFSMARGGIPVVALLLIGLAIDGHYYSEFPTPSAVLIGLAPFALWIGRIGPVRRLARWQAGLLCGIGVLIPLGLALAIALGVGASTPNPDPGAM